MKRSRRIWMIGAVALIWLAPAASVAEPSCRAEVDPSSGSLGDLLLSVSGPPERAVAVGMHFVGGDGSPFVAERVGNSWRRVRVPTEPGARTIELQDAFADGSRVWVVGAFRNDRPQAGYVEDGRWVWTRPVDPGDGEDEFLGVAVGLHGTVWAVGKHQVGSTYEPLIERYDGTTWSVVQAPRVEGSAVLKDVARAPNGVLYAAGWRVLPGGDTIPLVMRTIGDRWSDEGLEGSGLLSGIAVQPDGRPIAVGWRVGPLGDRAIAFRRGGWSWRRVHDTGDAPFRLTAVASGDVTVAVGTRFVDGVPQPVVVPLTGEGSIPLEVTGEAAPETGGDQLLGITGDGGSILAVGIRDATDAFASLVVAGDCATGTP
jgi:hypothetical protein